MAIGPLASFLSAHRNDLLHIQGGIAGKSDEFLYIFYALETPLT
jgi:hypothetical protein